MSSGSAQHFACAVVLRIFDGYAVAAFDEYPRNEIDSLLGAIDDDDFRGIADDGAGAAQVRGDGFAKCEAADGRAVVQLANTGLAGVAQQDAPPCFVGEDGSVGAAKGEVVAERDGLAAGEIDSLAGGGYGGAEVR